MVRVSVNLIVYVLIFAIIVSGTASSASIPDNKEAVNRFDNSSERNPLQYHLVTLPSTNKKRVDAMCIRYLSLIPKAMLIPKTAESTVYRLIANSFDSIDSAKKRKAELLRYCETPFVVKSDQGYTVIAGSQLTGALAVAEQKRLADKNISTTILELRVSLKQWQMKSAESFDIRDAVIMANKLAKAGVIAIIEPTAQKVPLVAGE
jgi:hypothetical protein